MSPGVATVDEQLFAPRGLLSSRHLLAAMDHELDPPLVTLGIPLSFLTVPAWWHLLNFL
jgi:hypothetical protein